MENRLARTLVHTLRAAAVSAAAIAIAQPISTFRWQTVANRNSPMPNSVGRTYNSFNQPSVNAKGLVLFRARSRGGPPLGPPARGIFTRDMAFGNATNDALWTVAGGSMELSRGATQVPYPNNTFYPATSGSLASFIEFPSIPRIGIHSNAIATRANHQPVWTYTPIGATESTRAGTSGVYVKLNAADPSQPVLTGASRLGAVPAFSPQFAVPGVSPPAAFDVFPGNPAITDSAVIAFKGNYTQSGKSKTGVFYRQLLNASAGGSSPIQLVANSDTPIPNLTSCTSYKRTTFDSTAPPSAAVDSTGVSRMVFVGLDEEDSPSCGGIYEAALLQPPKLVTLVAIGSPVPGVPGATFSRLGEGLSYDGRYVGFWGAWGNETRSMRLYCPIEGSQGRLDFCNNVGPFSGGAGDANSICNDQTDGTDRCYQIKHVLVNQGIFTCDTQTRQTRMIARTGDSYGYQDFVYWVYSGRVPGTHESEHADYDEGEEDGEPARWRSGSFIAVSGRGAAHWTAFKAQTQNGANRIDGIYLKLTPGAVPVITLLNTTMPGTRLDPEASLVSRISELGIERDGFRGRWLVISAKMLDPAVPEQPATHEDGMAGIYVTTVP